MPSVKQTISTEGSAPLVTPQQPREYPPTSVRLDLDPFFAEIRQREPVARVRFPDGREAWLVTGYEEARRVLSDPLFSRAQAVGRSRNRRRERHLTDMDPPEHTRMRRLVVRAFTHRRVEKHLRPRIEQIANDLLDAMEAAGPPADLVEGLALPLTVTVICEILGVPADDRGEFCTWADAFLATTAFTARQVAEAQENLTGYLTALIAKQRARPGSALLAELIRARDEDGRLTEDEIVVLGVGLLIAGYETTANELANVTYVLLTHPDQLRHLRERPASLPAAIEELLRWVPLGAAAGMPRVTTQDVRLGDVLIRAGETVFAARPAANRDESAFPGGETLDLARQPKSPHLAFGYGTHHCLGAHLARAELQVGLGLLLERFPRLRLAVPETELRWKTGLSVRGLRELPVTWGAD